MITYTATGIAKPRTWYAIVNVSDRDALTDVHLDLDGKQVSIHAWPEDRDWLDKVSSVLEEGFPALQAAIDRPWPVDGVLDVTEVSSAEIAGYAGLYDSADDEIQISEDLDEHVIIHEAAHAWFDRSMFAQRWITEGLADEYASRIVASTNAGTPLAPEPVGPHDRVAFRLNDWPPPSRIDDDTSDAEAFGYDASWTVMRAIVRDVTESRMRDVFDAAAAGTLTYAGAGPAERTDLSKDWRGFLDLVEDIGGSTTATALFELWVVSSTEKEELAARTSARTRYTALVATGRDWLPGAIIRKPMGAWKFKDAETAMTTAERVLADRDDLQATTVELGLAFPAALEPAYESAGSTDDLTALDARIATWAAATTTVRAARDALAAERDPLVTLGLYGTEPESGFLAALGAWAAGDDAGAVAGSAATLAALAGAAEIGRERALTAGIGLLVAMLVVMLVLVAAAWLVSRSRRRRRTVAAALLPGGGDGLGVGGPDPYATLAATPDPVEGAEVGGEAPERSRTGLMGLTRSRPSHEILSGDSADVYFARAESILAQEGRDPLVTMEVFSREDGVLCGIDEARNLLGHVLAGADPAETRVEALDDGDLIGPKEIVLRIRARYRRFGLYETAFLGMLAQSTGWATAARICVEAAAPDPVISFGARHIHPDITDVLDYAAIVGGCVGASTPAGARLAGLAPTGTMPHSLVLIFGDTVEAALAFDRHVPPDVPRIVLVDTFKDEAEEALRVAHALGDRLYGVRLDTPSERGRVTADLVHEVRARLDQAGFHHVKITVSGGLNPDRIRYFKEAGAPVDSYAVGSYISGATPIDFTGDIKEIDGKPIAKRGRIPGLTESPRLKPVDLAAYREA